MSKFIQFLGVGKLCIYLIQKSPLPRIIPKGLLQELVNCDLCLGFWVYLILGVLLDQNIDADIEKQNKLVSKLVMAGVSTFVMHLFGIGWKEKFETVIIE